MFYRPKIIVLIILLLTSAVPLRANAFTDAIKKIFSFEISESIFKDINKKLVGKIKAGNIRFTLPNKIDLDDVHVIDEHGVKVLSAKHVKAVISLPSLLTSNITISDAYVDSPIFYYTINKEVHNVIRVFETTGEPDSSKLRVTIANVRVDNGSFHMQHDAGVEIFAKNIQAAGMFWFEDGPFGVNISRVDIGRGSINVGKMQLPISDLTAQKLVISDELVSTPDLKFLYEKAKVTANGTVFIEKDVFDINANIDAPENTYPKGLAALPLVVPQFLGKAKLVGPLEDPQITATVDFGSTRMSNLDFKGGRALARINKHKIVIDSTSFGVGDRGSLEANGVIDLDGGKFEFSTTQKDLQAAELANFLSLNKKTAGAIDAKTKLSGSLFKEKNIISISTNGLIRNGLIEDITFGSNTKFNLLVDYVLDEKIDVKPSQISDNLGLSFAFSGNANLRANNFHFTYDLKARDLQSYFPTYLKGNNAKQFVSSGTIGYENTKYKLNGVVKATEALFKKYIISNVNFDVAYNDNNVKLSNINGSIFGGQFIGDVAIDDLQSKKKLTGLLELSHVDLAEAGPALDLGPVFGDANATLELSSTLENPNIKFEAEINNFEIDKLFLSNLEFNGNFINDKINISELNSFSGAGSISSEDIRLDLSSKKMAGKILLSNVDTSILLTKYFKNKEIKGVIFGEVELDGTFLAPLIKAPIRASQVEIFGIQLGHGNLMVKVDQQNWPESTKPLGNILSVSGFFKKNAGQADIRAALSLSSEAVNFQGDFSDIEFDTQRLPIPTNFTSARGRFDGTILASGKIDEPQIKANLTAKRYGFYDQRNIDASANLEERYGPAILSAELAQGNLILDSCISLGLATTFDQCHSREKFTFSLGGPFYFNKFDLDLKGSLQHTRLEDVFFEIKNELMTLGLSSYFRGKFSKKIDQPSEVNATVDIDKISVSMPNIPRIELKKPVTLSLTNGNFTLVNEAILAFFPGQLNIKGSFSPQNIDVAARGSIPLVLTRFITPMIQRAEGLASGEITLSGSSQAVIVDGSITPQPGSIFRLRKWIEPLEVKSGSISFEKKSATSFVSTLNNIRFNVGDGGIFIDGKYHVSYDAQNKSDDIIDINIEGNNIILKDQNDYIEADFKISTLQKNNGESVLTGNITVTDGFVNRQFGLRNFVAEAENLSRSDAFDFLKNINLNLDLKVSVRQFLASARMLNFDMEANLAGQLSAEGPISKPKIAGELIVTQGTIEFPNVTAELGDSRIELDDKSGKSFDPKITILATYEFLREEYPNIKQDTTVELSLKGDIDKLVLDLRPISGNMGMSRTDIFLLLLLPRSIAGTSSNEQVSDVLRRGAQNAAMAFSGEVFLRPVTNELQEIIGKRTNTRIRFGSALESGGVSVNMKWEIGPRVEMNGSYMLTSRSENNNSNLFIDDFHPLGELGLKFLLFDHAPFGPLFLETSFGANRFSEGKYEPRGKIRLKYTVFSR